MQGVLRTGDDPGDYYADIEYDKLHKSESTSHQYNFKPEYSESTKQESNSKTNNKYTGATYLTGDYFKDIGYDKLPRNQHPAIASPAEVVTRVKDTKPVGHPKKTSTEKKVNIYETDLSLFLNNLRDLYFVSSLSCANTTL